MISGGMMDYYGYSPNLPTVLYKPPQQERGKVDRDFLMDALPSKTKTAEVIAACYTLSRFSRDEVSNRNVPEEYQRGLVTEGSCPAPACQTYLTWL